ncbi:xylanase/chitin deacetylase [Penicillium angulare]|uniref:xylanase/chitin deacetylase n=1 Tax=Penicillium angulare TaxID=116970 RepID=UPI0025421FAE|nr:xylanase/chitin deacetylase [Penicillium angulare]KAJ5259306.1 xylanase/chitin deacetylase [Penicillium angulare]
MSIESLSQRSVLGLEDQHIFITGAASATGGEAVREFLDHGSRVTAFDNKPLQLSGIDAERFSRLHILNGDVTTEESIKTGFTQAQERFGPANILVIISTQGDVTRQRPIWELSLDDWNQTYQANVCGSFLAIKHFLRQVQKYQQHSGSELASPSIVVTETETSNGLAAGKAGLHYGLLNTVRNEILELNSEGRINAVASGIDETAKDNGVTPTDVARTMAFLASSRAAGHITGQCIQVQGKESPKSAEVVKNTAVVQPAQSIPRTLAKPRRNKIRVAVSIDLDAVSGWLGTNSHPDNVLADYSAGFFAARVGVPRLLRMLKKLDIANRCTWFIPGHSAESFPDEVKQVVESGCEVGLHGYAHEGAYQLTPEQERDVLVRCMEIAQNLTGKKPVGYRAPLYQLRESTLDLLEEHGFEYDASLTDHDCHPFFAPRRPPLQPIDFSKPASTWMHPVKESPSLPDRRPLVCVPCNYYMEDMTPMQFLPHCENSHGYVDVRVIENLWRDRFLWIRDNEEEPIFPILMHPDTSGMAHVIGMLERMLGWLKEWEREGEVEFLQTGEISRWWKEKMLNDKAK